jgi:hypothetical protein
MLRRSLFSLVLASLALGAAGLAEARQETIRWVHPLAGQVASFHVFVGSAPGSADLLSQNVGLPAPNGSGVYSITLDLASEATVYVRMTAVDSSSVHSPPSNEVSRSVPLGMPGTPVVALP